MLHDTRIPLWSYALWRLQNLELLLGNSIHLGINPFRSDCTDWLGWGVKRSAQRAARYARRSGGRSIQLEDGFLRSVELGTRDMPLSIVMDDLGIYYDATRPSRIESLISRLLTEKEILRTTALINAWRESRVSKYNHLRNSCGQLPMRYVLVIDQTFGDASIQYGLANSDSFHKMLTAALDENPDCTVLLKTHPGVFSRRKHGYLDTARISHTNRLEVLASNVHPARLIEHSEAVYTVTSQMGFEGLLYGKRVRTFGMPFYAGWGLTEDELSSPIRRGKASLEQLAHAALIEYPRYLDPETNTRCEAEQVLSHLALQRRMRERFVPVIYALGFSHWKRSFVRAFLRGSEIRFIRNASKVPKGASLAVWGHKPIKGELAAGVELLHLEDGFLRSVGLGADLVRPLSWVIDRRGIYYDATQPSDLEKLLQTEEFEPELVERAQILRERIVADGLTKYNVGVSSWSRPAVEGNKKRVILVPGQVENDASIRYGASHIHTNLGLLRTVRELNPDAWLVYKPHPDVRAGLRKAGEGEAGVAEWCDEVIGDVPMQTLLTEVDEVHLLTSLTGFEALLRGKPVVTYGQPFYAGWGLTQDISLLPEVAQRRGRHLSLDELVAATLILYPTYVSRVTGRFTTPERALDELLSWRQQGTQAIPLWRKTLRIILRTLKING